MKSRIAISLLLLGIVVTAVLYWPKSTTSGPATTTGSPADPSEPAPGHLQAPVPDPAGRESSEPSSVPEYPPAEQPAGTATRPAMTGVQPLTIDQEHRLEKFVEELATTDARVREFETLADHEEKDPSWSGEAERLLADAILRHGARLTALRASAPQCTRTVCRLVATGGLDSAAADADWQWLINAIMNEPWFSTHFMDTSTSVQGDPNGLMYVTYFVRKT